jgi:LysM repeat protein
MKGYVTLVVMLLVAVSGAQADNLDDQYIQIFNLIQEADALNKDQPTKALASYLEAQTALQRLKNGSPDWNSAIVGFRLSYVAAKIAALSGKAPAPAETIATTNAAGKTPRAAPPADWEGQLATLKDQVRQLQAERVILEAKLKEAFAVLPTESDPRELARAEERIKNLQKENELLKLSLEKAKAPAEPEATAKAAEQTQEQLAVMKRQLAEQQALVSRLTSEKAALEARAGSSRPSDKELAALRAENELLKKRVASLSADKSARAKTPEAAGQVTPAQAQVAALQSDRDMLRLQLTALDVRVKQLSASNSTPVAAAPPQDSERMQQLERERNELQQQLALAKTNSSNALGKIEALERERQDLQSQLAQAKELAASPAAPALDLARIQQLECERDELQNQLVATQKELQNRAGQPPNTRPEPQNQLAAAQAPLDVLVVGQAHHSSEDQALSKKSATELAQAPAKLEPQDLTKPDQPGLPAGETAPRAAAAEAQSRKSAFPEERFILLSAQLDDLLLAKKAQQKQVADLAKAIEGLRQQLKPPDGSYASQEDLTRLVDATRQLDQARLKDDEQIHTELVTFSNMLITPPAVGATYVASGAPSASKNGHEYTIKSGDTLSGIARAYREKNINVSVDQILKANPGLRPERLRPGQKILIPVPIALN